MPDRTKASLSFIKKLSKDQKALRRRFLQFTHEANLSHIGSGLCVIDIVDTIYNVKAEGERFVLSAGHSAMAYYVVLEKYGLIKPEDIKKLHIHPDRNPSLHIDVSTGSLGQGLPIALGMALADRKRNVYCIISDGESAEGSIWEAVRVIHDVRVTNLKIVLVANGWGACGAVSVKDLIKRFKGFGLNVMMAAGHNQAVLKALLAKRWDTPSIICAKTNPEQLPFLEGLSAHYHVMSQEQFNQAMEFLS